MKKDTSSEVRVVVCGRLQRGRLAGRDAGIVYCRQKGKSWSNTDFIGHVVIHGLQTAKLCGVALHKFSDDSGYVIFGILVVDKTATDKW